MCAGDRGRVTRVVGRWVVVLSLVALAAGCRGRVKLTGVNEAAGQAAGHAAGDGHVGGWMLNPHVQVYLSDENVERTQYVCLAALAVFLGVYLCRCAVRRVRGTADPGGGGSAAGDFLPPAVRYAMILAVPAAAYDRLREAGELDRICEEMRGRDLPALRARLGRGELVRADGDPHPPGAGPPRCCMPGCGAEVAVFYRWSDDAHHFLHRTNVDCPGVPPPAGG